MNEGKKMITALRNNNKLTETAEIKSSKVFTLFWRRINIKLKVNHIIVTFLGYHEKNRDQI